jgi:hypothetical protein
MKSFGRLRYHTEAAPGWVSGAARGAVQGARIAGPLGAAVGAVAGAGMGAVASGAWRPVTPAPPPAFAPLPSTADPSAHLWPAVDVLQRLVPLLTRLVERLEAPADPAPPTEEEPYREGGGQARASRGAIRRS